MLSKLLRNSLLMLLFFSAVSACKKDDNPAGSGTGGGGGNSFTINGSGWNNVTYTVPSATSPDSSSNPFALGYFITEDSATAVLNVGVVNGSDSTKVQIAFQSKQTGTFQGNSTVVRVIQVSSRGRNFVGGRVPEGVVPNTTADLNVTRYEAVGGRIQGSYTGTLRELVGLSFGNETITITGNFDVQRLPDDFDDGGGNIKHIRPFAHEQ
jgi:hypothetical protein